MIFSGGVFWCFFGIFLVFFWAVFCLFVFRALARNLFWVCFSLYAKQNREFLLWRGRVFIVQYNNNKGLGECVGVFSRLGGVVCFRVFVFSWGVMMMN